MHILFAVDGLPEGIEDLKRQMDRHDFGNGGQPARLREIRFFDWQIDSKDKKEALAVLAYNTKEIKWEKQLSHEYELEENPFKQGKVKWITYWAIKLFGGLFGFKPIEPTEKPEPQNQIRKWLVNTFPIAVVDDNFIINKVHKMREESL